MCTASDINQTPKKYSILTSLVYTDRQFPTHIWPVKMGNWWKWALASPDGLVPSRMVCVSASVNLPLHHKVQKFSSGTGSPGWSRKKAVKWLCVCVCVCGVRI